MEILLTRIVEPPDFKADWRRWFLYGILLLTCTWWSAFWLDKLSCFSAYWNSC